MIDRALQIATEYDWKLMPLHNPISFACSCRDPECKSIGKHPRIKIGLGMSGATNDPTKIKEWWTNWPQANIGIATGQSSLMVTDVDPKNGGADSLPGLVEKFPELNEAPRARTGGDGLHFYFKQPRLSEPIHNTAGALAPGIDTRGVGGLIVAPGSLHASGKTYEWVKGYSPSEVRLNEPSLEFARFIQQSKANADKRTKDSKGLMFIPKGARNDMVARTVGFLHQKGFCREAVVACMREFNVRQMEAPLREQELIRTIDSILRYPRK